MTVIPSSSSMMVMMTKKKNRRINGRMNGRCWKRNVQTKHSSLVILNQNNDESSSEEEDSNKNNHRESNSNNGSLHPQHYNNPTAKTLVDAYTPLLNQRLTQLRTQILEQQVQKPPNPKLDPEQVITLLLEELRGGDDATTSNTSSNHEVLPDSGFRTLLRTSTNRWKSALRKSVGAPSDVTEEQLVSALSTAMSRPNNQYQILVSSHDYYENENDNDDEGNNNDDDEKKYHLYFPGDVFEYDEGKAWVETQLRHPKSGKLLAILAWSLIRCEEYHSWLVDWIDWQDFRDAFRPGIGREEWSRICG